MPCPICNLVFNCPHTAKERGQTEEEKREIFKQDCQRIGTPDTELNVRRNSEWSIGAFFATRIKK